MCDDILQIYPTLDLNLVHVIRNGIDTEMWYSAGPTRTGPALAELDIDLNWPTVAFAGRITRQKGITHLVERPRIGLARTCR